MLRLVRLEPEERRPFLWGFAAFFLLFFGWYTVRPIREAMGIQRGAGDLPWLMLATLALTFITNPLLGRLVTRWPRALLVRRVYRFLAWNLVGFHLLLVLAPLSDEVRVWLGFGLYSWVSVFSLLIGSLLWSLLNEVFGAEAGRRLFGPLAAACSLGGLAGASLTGSVVGGMDQPLHLLLLVAVVLEVAARCARQVARTGGALASARSAPADGEGAAPIELGGSAWTAGLRAVLGSPYLCGIGGYLLGYTIIGTWAYFWQGMVVDAMEQDLGRDVQTFAWIDALVNATSLVLQLAAVDRVVRKIGVGWTLATVPLVYAGAFGLLVAVPTVQVVAAFQVVRRSLNYGLVKPAREMLFGVLSRRETYLAKNLLDLFVYRGGDALGAATWQLLTGALALGLGGLAVVAAPVSLAWAALGPWLGRRYRALQGARKSR